MNLSLSSALSFVYSLPRMYSRWWWQLFEDSPRHVVLETILICFLIWLMFLKKTPDPKKKPKLELSDKEINELVEEWTPEPLVSPPTEKELFLGSAQLVVESMNGCYIKAKGKDKQILNLASFDFFGMGQNPKIKEVAAEKLEKYGCGSCGPRGFYGTIDVHLEIENKIAEFMGTEAAISYSDSASTVTSTIPAFAKRGDILVIDEGAHEPVLTGALLSRSLVKYFKHNDMNDLERVLQSIDAEDKKLKRNVTEQRRFIIVEGLYKNFGDICDLPKILELKKRYRYRLILDETFSFGTLGQTGRGVTELYGVPITSVEIITLSMANSLGSIGGLCIGNHEVVDHQRLSGAGYCFSASAPPFMSSCAITALQHLKQTPELITTLHSNINYLFQAMENIKELKILSSKLSPIVHIGISPNYQVDFDTDFQRIVEISLKCLDNGVFISVGKYVDDKGKNGPPPTLRMGLNSNLSTKDLDTAINVLASVSSSIFGN